MQYSDLENQHISETHLGKINFLVTLNSRFVKCHYQIFMHLKEIFFRKQRFFLLNVALKLTR